MTIKLTKQNYNKTCLGLRRTIIPYTLHAAVSLADPSNPCAGHILCIVIMSRDKGRVLYPRNEMWIFSAISDRGQDADDDDPWNSAGARDLS